MRKPKNLWCTIFLLVMSYTITIAQTELHALFTDNMVLQRNAEVPVWGWAEAGENITVSFNGKTVSNKADRDGKWQVELPKMYAGGPYDMTISSSGAPITLQNIMVGDVWVCSGQSNMEWTVQNSNNAEAEIAAANDARIRHFKVPHTYSDTPEDKLEGGPWEVTSSETVGDFTAVGYYFAKNVRQHEDVAIGLLNSSWGGSRVEPWMSAQALGYPDAKGILVKIRQEQEERLQASKAKLEAKVGPLPEKDVGMQDDNPIWVGIEYDDSDWQTMVLPMLWESELPDLDGIVWFRKTIKLSEAEAEAGITLHLGKIDDSDITWVNGQKVGEMTQKYNVDRYYEVEPDALQAGENVITVRVEDTGGGGGIYGAEDLLFIESRAGQHSLAGDWKFKVGEARFGVSNRGINHQPTLLYNKMIHPILDFPITGVIWYQGESNASETDAYKYRTLFADMIKDWRKRWNNSGQFPFLFVQLANFMEPPSQPAESNWAMLRESQSETLSLPKTAQAIIIDIGEADDIHPRNKQDVGYRLALAARKYAYGEDDVVYSGPVFKSMKKEGDKIRIGFRHTGSGLMAKDRYGYLKGFAIAGADKEFVWAKAQIDGDEVIVWSDEVSNPVAVRYAWADNPDDANLYNQEGLPASPFRTDEW